VMTFGPNQEWGAKTTSLEEFGQFLDAFKEYGYDEVDTSRLYQQGQQEAFTGAIGWKERGFKLATKVYPITPGLHSPCQLREQLETSLRELRAISVDTFYLHAADRSVPFAETLDEVDTMYREGKFKQFGLSNFAAFEVAEIVMTCSARGWIRPTIYQAMYNAITRSIEAELIPTCRRYGLDIVTYNGLAGGLFTGKYSSNNTTAPQVLTQVDKTYRARFLTNASLEALSVIEPVVRKYGLTLIETGLRWLVHHSGLRMRRNGGNDGILTGASSLEQFKMTLPLFEKGPLPREVVEVLDAAWRIAKAEAPEYWFGELKYGYDTTRALFS
ncbi:aflatoxin B1 aldehyde reductase member 2, partial [Lindgomyces ingoldianus]